MKKMNATLLASLMVFTLCLPASAGLSLITPAPVVSAQAAPTINATKQTITGPKKTFALKVSNQPAGTKVTWTSSNKSIATVSSTGVVTSVKKGKATITCNIRKGKKLVKKFTCAITVVIPASKIRINNAKIDATEKAHIIKLGETYDFNSKITGDPKNYSSSYKGYYKVEDESIATVSSTGIVTPKKVGKTKLTVYAGLNKTAAINDDNPFQDYIYISVVDTPVAVNGTPNLTSSKTLVVHFTQPMLASTLVDTNGALTSNISIISRYENNKFADDVGALKGEFSKDGKTLTITSTNDFNGVYELRILKGALSANAVPLNEIYMQTLSLVDTTPPTYIGTTIDETGIIAMINFNEPLDITSLGVSNVKKNGASVTDYSNFYLSTVSNYKLSKDKKTLLFDMSDLPMSDRSATYTVDLYGIRDSRGNFSNSAYTVQLMADTATKPQANCTNIVRTGNSLVATFSLPIQTPGYVTVDGYSVYGIVNESNRKEVIYSLKNSHLADKKETNVLVSLFGFSGYNTAQSNTTTTAQRYVNFATSVNPLTITNSTLTSQKINNVTKPVLTLTFNKPISSIISNGTLQIVNKSSDTVLPAETYSYTANASDNVATIVLDNSLIESSYYTITIPAYFVTDIYENGNTLKDITLQKTGGSVVALPAPVSIQLDALSNSIVYVTFNDKLDRISAETASNYMIQNTSVTSASVISSGDNTPTVIKLTLSNAINDNLAYAITISGIKGSNGSYTVMKPYKEQILFSSNRELKCIDITATASSSKLVLTTTSMLSSNSVIDYTFKQAGTKTLSLKSSVIKDNTITFEFNEKISAGTTITMIPSKKNNIKNASNSTLLNTAYNVTFK